MDPCIVLCYYYILTKKNPVYKYFLKCRDGNPFTRSTRQIKASKQEKPSIYYYKKDRDGNPSTRNTRQIKAS
jgi:hypothetical protein